MTAQNTSDPPPLVRNRFRERMRKTAIVLVLIGSMLPPLFLNVALNAQNATWSASLMKANVPSPSFGALLLCQLWALFASISPYNYSLHYEVALTNGEVRPLRDLKKEAAGKWQSVLFHNEAKTELNLYSDRRALRYYMEYLISSNNLDPAWVVRRTILVRYQLVLPREKAAAAGTHYGPVTTSVVDTY